MHQTVNITLEEVSNIITNELDCFEKEYLGQFQTDNTFLQPLLNHIGQLRGKRLRPILFFLSQGLFDQPNLKSTQIAVLLELLHTASLVHDDVVDGSSIRRGRRTLNAIWGDRVSVLVGDYLLAKVLSLGVEVSWKGVLDTISRVVLDMGQGEIQQIMGGRVEGMTVEEYFRVVKQKTAGLIAAACELGGRVMDAPSSERRQLSRFGEYFGTAFQIRDDILDLSGVVYLMGKPVGQDFSNGRVTLPILLALDGSSDEEKERVFKKLENSTESDGKWIREFVEKRGGILRAQERAAFFSKKAVDVLELFKPSIYREGLERLVMYDLKRVG